MNGTGDTSGAMLCGHCGRPMACGVWIGGRMYHHECTHGPGGPLHYEPIPPALSEEDIRRIVREELARKNKPWAFGIHWDEL